MDCGLLNDLYTINNIDQPHISINSRLWGSSYILTSYCHYVAYNGSIVTGSVKNAQLHMHYNAHIRSIAYTQIKALRRIEYRRCIYSQTIDIV